MQVQPLFDCCLSMLVDHIDCVESLSGLPDAIKVRTMTGRREACYGLLQPGT